MTPELIAKYDSRVPRYTSYPTAPHFTPAVGADAYRQWLGALDRGPLSLYLHVPFCEKLCWYCGCHTRVISRYRPLAIYLDLLEREIDLVAEALPRRLEVTHVHWGGGTPTMVAGADFRRLTERLRRRFTVLDDAEMAVEMDPRGVTAETVADLAAAGVNRVSLGVQDFDAAVQRAVNRVQPFEMTARVVDWLRAAGIDRLNLDLMYGLPQQTVAAVERTVALAMRLEPQRVAQFGYAHVPWMKRHQRLIDEATLPGPEERWRQAAAGAARLEEAGFVAIGLDHFARPDDPLAVAQRAGTLRRNFQGYTTDRADALIGLGASSIGALPQGYVQNAPDMPTWRRAVEAGTLATVRGIALDDDDRLRRAVIERLMCDLAVDLDRLCRHHGANPGTFEAARAALAAMQRDGLVRIAGDRIAVTEVGRPLVRSVCAAFDRYLSHGEARHARAV
jgi:oxygen-independent coproporphyrinogen-3 oxidase